MTYGHGGRFPAPGQVFVRDGCARWHATRSCDERDAREGDFAYHCSLDAAHRSPLVPCPSCASELRTLADTLWGAIAPYDRARLPLPRLLPLAPEPGPGAAPGDRQLVQGMLSPGR